MITERKGDVLKLEAGLIVHGCNCQGVMGSGIAAQVRKIYPAAYDEYMEDYENELLVPGLVSYVCIPTGHFMPKYIVNAYTQEYYGGGNYRYVDYEAVASAFEKIGTLAKKVGLRDAVCFPKIGAGLGGGNWKIISTIIDETLPDSDGFRKYVYTL